MRNLIELGFLILVWLGVILVILSISNESLKYKVAKLELQVIELSIENNKRMKEDNEMLQNQY